MNYYAGIDIGSTTAKLVICNKTGQLLFGRYRRHYAKDIDTVRNMLKDALKELGNIPFGLTVTGSAGMGAAETFNVPFTQEVVASARFIRKNYPEVATFIEIGGEDSKIVFFDDHSRPDIRMNGSCAGGTGAFIDQMAVLLHVDIAKFNALAQQATSIYPIASRCGVFAKTDVQALLSQGVSREDVAASVFHAVATQVITALSRGRDIKTKVLFGGGPLTFFPELRRAFVNTLNLDASHNVIIPEHPELIPAMGTAFTETENPCLTTIKDCLALPEHAVSQCDLSGTKRLPSLFDDRDEFDSWQQDHARNRIRRTDLTSIDGRELFLGIDSGSTTTKLVLIDDEGRLVLDYYSSNNGDPIGTVKTGFSEFSKKFKETGFSSHIVRTAVTGYGEDFIKAAFGLDDGVVETMAHYRAASVFAPDVSFVMDIGGQDMKAIYISDKAVSDIQINEACSSGCGTFIETFAHLQKYTPSEFAKIACQPCAPFDLGTRCTVFMNSRVKQALREGATVQDISAGLAYSVIKNALYKVLKLRDVETLGSSIVAQGGTFRNDAVLRALELLLKKTVVRPDIPELMGAYGAALTALQNHRRSPSKKTGFESFMDVETRSSFSKKETHCHGCTNNCRVTVFTFSSGNHFFTGNKCERFFSNSSTSNSHGRNLIAEKMQLLFDQPAEPVDAPILTYGIPRCLNLYENFPFWSTFLRECRFKIVLSSPSNMELFKRSTSTIISENICLPAKMSHSHILDLIDKQVDRIFYPIIVYEQQEDNDAINTYNCPVVTGYPDVLKSSISPDKKYGISFDNPAISFRDTGLLKKQLYLFFKQFGIDETTISRAVEKGLSAHKKFKSELVKKSSSLLIDAAKAGRTVVVLAGRPYHIDPLINHGIPELLTNMGVDVITEDAVPFNENESLSDINVLTQWTYTNRLYHAAKWVRNQDNVQLVQLTSFGCGPDAISSDEIRDILNSKDKIYTLIKMDEVSNLGAVKIRLRSMLEAVRERSKKIGNQKEQAHDLQRITSREESKRTLIAPYFSPFYSSLTSAVFRPLGYKVDVLPPQDKASIEYGLRHINNDICYPAVLIAGDILKAFKSGQYDPAKTAVIITQTGGQCRASNYVALIKKALISANMANVPIISFSTESLDTELPFAVDTKALKKRLALAIAFSDPLAQMYLATVVREKIAGVSKALHNKYLKKMETGIEKGDFQYLLTMLGKAVADFNAIPIVDQPIPIIGIVGEIFVKYNCFANGNIIEWLSNQGVEVVLPTLQSFFTRQFVEETFNQKAFFKHSYVDALKSRLFNMYVNYHLIQIDWVMRAFRFYRKPCNLKEIIDTTEKVVSLANQFGEGWVLTADMIAMLKSNINNIVCLQPFGCISNHITGKGLERAIKDMFPRFNLLSIDMDAGGSEVNILNRLQFMLIAAREEPEQEDEEVSALLAKLSLLQRFRSIDIAFPDNKYIGLEVEKWKSWISGLGLREKIRKLAGNWSNEKKEPDTKDFDE